MPRPSRRLATVQLDLFPTMEPRPLDWHRLSAAVREQVTRLLAQMLSDQQASQHSDRGDGGPIDE